MPLEEKEKRALQMEKYMLLLMIFFCQTKMSKVKDTASSFQPITFIYIYCQFNSVKHLIYPVLSKPTVVHILDISSPGTLIIRGNQSQSVFFLHTCWILNFIVSNITTFG